MLEQKVNDFFDLHKACHFGKIDRVKHWIQQGSDPNTLDTNTGKTPLIVAAQNGHEDIVHFLCTDTEGKTDLDATGVGGLTVRILKFQPSL